MFVSSGPSTPNSLMVPTCIYCLGLGRASDHVTGKEKLVFHRPIQLKVAENIPSMHSDFKKRVKVFVYR